MAALASDDNFRHDCAVYAENLSEGKHDSQWLEEAWAAHCMRKAGEFDGYLKQKFEMEWGEAIPDEIKARLNGLPSACEQGGIQAGSGEAEGNGEAEVEAGPGGDMKAAGGEGEVSAETKHENGG